jgi:hypothetical protein
LTSFVERGFHVPGEIRIIYTQVGRKIAKDRDNRRVGADVRGSVKSAEAFVALLNYEICENQRDIRSSEEMRETTLQVRRFCVCVCVYRNDYNCLKILGTS